MTREALIERAAVVRFLRARGREEEALAIENGGHAAEVSYETQRIAMQKVVGRNAEGLRALAGA